MCTIHFGERLKAYRMYRKWKLRQVAALTGVGVGTLSKIENEKVAPHDLTKAKIRDALPSFDEITQPAA